MIKARVARGPWTSYNETTDFTMPAPQAHTQAQAKAQQPAPQDHTQAHAEVQQPVPAASESSSLLFEQSVRLPGDIDIMTSGPLPSVAGFEDLVGWVADNPQDIGAHMALASAYAQSEDLDSALRVYRRIIKKSSTSGTMLKMIWDDLSDLNPPAQHLPRYHQLSGDLLLRLGRHREAVEAYNRLQTNETE
jgi:tetratricopeptide (TPR) repeat protein